MVFDFDPDFGPYPTKTFNGKEYTFERRESNKSKAKEVAQNYRKYGLPARITQENRLSGRGKEYWIWVGRSDLPSPRTFGGKEYQFESSEATKFEAEETARRYRKQGYHARITSDNRRAEGVKKYKIGCAPGEALRDIGKMMKPGRR